MRRASVLLLACCAHAQQQTGAPAGIAVPSQVRESTLPNAPEVKSVMPHFRVRVLDGRTGAAVQNAHVKLWYDEPAGPGYEFVTDGQGLGLMPQPSVEPVRVLATVLDYADCRKRLRGDPPAGYNLQLIASRGVAAQNGCGSAPVRTSAGELVLFVRHSRWYEQINRNSAN